MLMYYYVIMLLSYYVIVSGYIVPCDVTVQRTYSACKIKENTKYIIKVKWRRG